METKTILIVDDEESVLYVLRNSLLNIGHEYRILTALDGKSALKYFEKYQIDLVITDYKMSGMNGLELIETISTVQPSTRMILITGFGTDEIEAQARRLNVFAYLKKPIELNLLRYTAKQALGEINPSQSGVKVTKSDIHLYLRQLIEQLQHEINASYVLFADIEEKSHITAGQDDSLPADQLISFFNTALAMAEKANDLLGDNGSENETWIAKKGSRVNICAVRVDNKHLLIVLINSINPNLHKNIDAMLSLIVDIRNVLTYSTTKTGKEKLFDTGFNQAVQSELDKLFTDSLETNEESASTQAMPDHSFSMSYEEALSLGLILPTEDHNNPGNQ